MAMRSQTQRSLLIGFIASIAACGLIGIWCLLVGEFGELAEDVLGTTATVGAASILALAAAIPWERRRWHPVGPFGVAAVTVALVFILIAIWFEPRGRYEAFYKSLGVFCVLGVALPHIGLMALARLRRQYESARIATVVVTALLATQIIVTILDAFDGDLLFLDEDLWFRFMGVLAIAAACGTVAVPILHRVSAIRVQAETHTVDLSADVTLVCPRCHKSQRLPLGRSRCGNCGLHLRVDIEEEHCAKCGYLLYKLESAVCPECGTPIAEPTAAE